MSASNDVPDDLPRVAARGVFSNYVGQFVVLGAAILLTPIILHGVGETSYSLWVLASALTGYGGLLDLGIAVATQKYVSEYRARGDSRELSRIVTASLALFGGLGVAAFLVFIALAPLVPDLFGVDDDYARTASWLTILVGAQVAIMLPGSLNTAILRGSHRFDLANLVTIVGTLLNAAAIVAVLWLGGGIVALAVVSTASAAVTQIPALWLVRRAVPELRFDAAGVTRRRIRAILSFSVGVLAFRLADIVTRRADPLVIGAALPIQMITPYALAQRVPEAALILTNQISGVFMPIASDLDARKQRPALGGVLIGSTRVSLAVGLTLNLSIAILGSSILTVWVGSEYAAHANLVTILAAASLVSTAGLPATSIMIGIAKHRVLGWIAVATAAVQVTLSLALVFPYGLTGVAIGALVPAVLETLVFVLPYSLMTIGTSARDLASKAILPNILPAAALACVDVALASILDTDHIVGLLLTLSAGITAYAAVYVPFSSGPQERAFYRQLAGRVLPSLAWWRSGA